MDEHTEMGMDNLGPRDIAMWGVEDVNFDYPLARDTDWVVPSTFDDEQAAHMLWEATLAVNAEHPTGGIIEEHRALPNGNEVWTLTENGVRAVREHLRRQRGSGG
ncbi:hypothetical protein [Halostreptopolyspora alba]|uniref:Uncharacterized protein n=1 Tax=Halostreptopolyspora alba TaxID=2487137 RepID=A0A3N0DZ15_9ACTN|nr:hypothetical protein EFW17_22580 [Nocardiopsaceae bacterium YIM 96095]